MTTEHDIQSFLAFDASPVSDYPEEQEYLVASAYVRVMGIETRPMYKTWDSFQGMEDDYLSIQQMASAPRIRSIFYAVHLFLGQIFSMSTHLEFWVTAFLHMLCPLDPLDNDSRSRRRSRTRSASVIDADDTPKYPLQFTAKLQRALNGRRLNFDEERDEKEYRILKILHQKMAAFLAEPNHQQCLKLDVISEYLKPYFMDSAGLALDGNGQRYVVSFKRIMKMFPNLKVIQFMNSYLFDVTALTKLVQYLEGNRDSTLRTVKFLYYQYTASEKPENEKAFLDPELLDQDVMARLRKLDWDMTHCKIKDIGYQIRLNRC